MPAGEITFVIDNQGRVEHELVILSTDLAAESLPLNPDGSVDENAPGGAVVDVAEGIGPRGGAQLTVSLSPGHYLAISNIADDFSQGMFADFFVD